MFLWSFLLPHSNLHCPQLHSIIALPLLAVRATRCGLPCVDSTWRAVVVKENTMHHNCVDSSKLIPAPFYVIMQQFGGTGKLWATPYGHAQDVQDWINSHKGWGEWEIRGFLEWAESARPGEMFKSEYFVVLRALDTP